MYKGWAAKTSPCTVTFEDQGPSLTFVLGSRKSSLEELVSLLFTKSGIMEIRENCFKVT
jgi:hypothetical protein